MNKHKINIGQGVVFVISFITTVVIGIVMVAIVASWQPVTDFPEKADQTEALYSTEPKQSGPKYRLNNPKEDLDGTVIPEVTEETVTQKSNRMEDILDVLSAETE